MPICCQRPITNHPTCGDVLFLFATKYKTAFVIVAFPCHVETLVHSLEYPAFSNEVDICTADLLKAIGYVAVPIDVIFASASAQVVTPHCSYESGLYRWNARLSRSVSNLSKQERA